MAEQEARSGVSVVAEIVATPSQTRQASAILDAEPELGLNYPYVGRAASAELLMEMEGVATGEAFPGYIAQPDDAATTADLLMEVEGNPHNSLVFAYLQDAGSARPARLLQQAVEGLPEENERLFWFVALDSAYTLYAGYGEADTAATGDTTFLLKKKSGGTTTTVATVVFHAGETTPAVTITDSAVAVGDRLSFHAPAPQDATLADLLVAFVLTFA